MALTQAKELQQKLTVVRSEVHNLRLVNQWLIVFFLNKINNTIFFRKQLNTLQHKHNKDINNILNQLKNIQIQNCHNEKLAEPHPTLLKSQSANLYQFKPIGTINSPFPRIRGTPRQPTVTMHNARATLKLNKDTFTNPSHSLHDLEQFSHLWIIFVFHKHDSGVKAKVAPPRLNGEKTGVFATRSPHRPCPIGMSLVKIEKIVEDVIYFSGVDMIDGTPVLDVKPYIPHYDQPNGVLEDKPLGQDLLPNEAVRVPLWIDKSPVHKLKVLFNSEAIEELWALDPQVSINVDFYD